MVFESLVVDVLNRFLGDYVVNLDGSQLSLGIWKGNGVAVPVSGGGGGGWRRGFSWLRPLASPAPPPAAARLALQVT